MWCIWLCRLTQLGRYKTPKCKLLHQSAFCTYNGYLVCIPGVKRPGSGIDHPPHLQPRLKKDQSCISTPFWAFVTCSKMTVTLINTCRVIFVTVVYYSYTFRLVISSLNPIPSILDQIFYKTNSEDTSIL